MKKETKKMKIKREVKRIILAKAKRITKEELKDIFYKIYLLGIKEGMRCYGQIGDGMSDYNHTKKEIGL